MSDLPIALLKRLSEETKISLRQVSAAVQLLEEGNTIPFIARYRKEMTGSLDEVQIRVLQERWEYYKELEERKKTILESIETQGKLTDELKSQILDCLVKAELEDLYLPFKPKRRTRAMIAREKGLEPLAQQILAQSKETISSSDEDLAGARDIVAEVISEMSEVRSYIRHIYIQEGVVVSKVVSGKENEISKYEQYYDFKERASTIPSHRYLAIRRGENEGVLSYGIEVEAEPIFEYMQKHLQLNPASPYANHLDLAIQDAYKRLISPSIETELRVELKIKSDGEAISVFAENVRHVLLSAPLGAKVVIGIDPGLRTGCKCAAVDHTGKFCEFLTIFLHSPEKSEKDLLKLIHDYQPYAIAIGNGTAGRETEDFVRKLLKEHQLKEPFVVQVSESGASVYSASDCAREEFPELDLTIRGAISIARRLQDPLSELVKVDPKAIGVGQYQHDVHQPYLQQKLQDVVESCVNQVGVELNTASSSLLSYVAGIGPTLAQRILKYRNDNGSFQSRKELLKIPGLGPKTFEQSAGFLRIADSKHPLDCSAVHPERYAIVEQMAKDLQVALSDLIANSALLGKIELKKYAQGNVGIETLQDILGELKKPGRDPREVFEPIQFQDHIREVKDLKPGMKMQGVVTNVTAFGAFVDIGVHQDGLVHISQLSDRFIKDPSEVVKAGDKIHVEVLQIDIERNRVSLTARKGDSKPKITQKAAPNLKQKKFLTNPFEAL